jgi:hypothetical protein
VLWLSFFLSFLFPLLFSLLLLFISNPWFAEEEDKDDTRVVCNDWKLEGNSSKRKRNSCSHSLGSPNLLKLWEERDIKVLNWGLSHYMDQSINSSQHFITQMGIFSDNVKRKITASPF